MSLQITMAAGTNRLYIQPMFWLIAFVVMILSGLITAMDTFLSRGPWQGSSFNGVTNPSTGLDLHNVGRLVFLGVFLPILLSRQGSNVLPGFIYDFFSISLVILGMLLSNFIPVGLVSLGASLGYFGDVFLLVFLLVLPSTRLTPICQSIMRLFIFMKFGSWFKLLAHRTAFHFTSQNGDPHRLAVLLSRQHPINLWGPRKIKNPPVGLSCLDTDIIARGRFWGKGS